jgi:hypothetical protein
MSAINLISRAEDLGRATCTMTPEQSAVPPPFIAVPGLPNLRDIGGQPVTILGVRQRRDSEEGIGHAQQHGRKVIRRGIVYRSAEPSKASDEGIAMLTDDLGIKLVYDLRSKVEIDRAHSKTLAENWEPREWPGSKRVFVPVFLDQDYSPEALAVRFGQYSHHSSEVGHGMHLLPLKSLLYSSDFSRDSLRDPLIFKHNRVSFWRILVS